MKKIIYIALVAVLLTSCEKLLMPKSQSTGRVEVFEEIWKTIDESYPLFVQTNVNWDSIHAEFRNKVFDTMTERQLYDTCIDMLSLLYDAEVSLDAGFAKYYHIDSGNTPNNFNKSILEKKYWQGIERTGPLLHKVFDSVAYVYYENFDETLTDAQLEVVTEKFGLDTTINSIIFDVRNNRSTKVENIFRLCKQMGIDSFFKYNALLYKVAYKNGPEHDDLTKPQATFIEQNDKRKLPRRFILLTNKGTYGTANLFAAGASNYPNIRVWGGKTGGGSGYTIVKELSNGWKLYLPGCYTEGPFGQCINFGAEPDSAIIITPADEANGVDRIIDAALNELRK